MSTFNYYFAYKQIVHIRSCNIMWDREDGIIFAVNCFRLLVLRLFGQATDYRKWTETIFKINDYAIPFINEITID